MGLHEVQEYRFGTQTWSFVEVSGIMPEPRWGHTAFVKDSVMYILGGKNVYNFVLDEFYKCSLGKSFEFAHLSLF